MSRSIKVTRIKLDGTKTTKTLIRGQNEVIAETVTAPVQSGIANIKINMPDSAAPDNDQSTVSKSPFSGNRTRIDRQNRVQQPTIVPDTPIDQLITVKIGDIETQGRMMTTEANELGMADTLVCQCPVCNSRIEVKFPSDDSLQCNECGLGKKGVIMEKEMMIVEPLSCGLIGHAELGLVEALQIQISDE